MVPLHAGFVLIFCSFSAGHGLLDTSVAYTALPLHIITALILKAYWKYEHATINAWKMPSRTAWAAALTKKADDTGGLSGRGLFGQRCLHDVPNGMLNCSMAFIEHTFPYAQCSALSFSAAAVAAQWANATPGNFPFPVHFQLNSFVHRVLCVYTLGRQIEFSYVYLRHLFINIGRTL